MEAAVKWMLLVLLYGLLKGGREIVKKKALTKNSVIEVLILYTLLSFLMVAPTAPEAMGLTGRQLFFVAVKSFVIFLAWICSFHAIKKLPISLYGILDLSRVLFATMLGVVVLKETMSPFQVAGLFFVSLGLLMLKGERKAKKTEANISAAVECTGRDTREMEEKAVGESGEIRKRSSNLSASFYVVIALLSCLFNGLSGMMDKLLMKEMTSAQLQFWYMLFLVGFYFLYVLVSRTRPVWSKLFCNYWVWILSIMFVVADRALFEANAISASRITVMTLIKQSGCIVTILGGKYVFHEKHIGYRLFCAGVILFGIVIGVMR